MMGRRATHFAELKALGVGHLFGLSTQDRAYQREAAERLHLPFPILSDEHLKLTRVMNLPTFETSGMTLSRLLGDGRCPFRTIRVGQSSSSSGTAGSDCQGV